MRGESTRRSAGIARRWRSIRPHPGLDGPGPGDGCFASGGGKQRTFSGRRSSATCGARASIGRSLFSFTTSRGGPRGGVLRPRKPPAGWPPGKGTAFRRGSRWMPIRTGADDRVSLGGLPPARVCALHRAVAGGTGSECVPGDRVFEHRGAGCDHQASACSGRCMAGCGGDQGPRAGGAPGAGSRDIAIDLAGHTGGTRLSSLVLRPAPITANYNRVSRDPGTPAWTTLVDSTTDPAGADASRPRSLCDWTPASCVSGHWPSRRWSPMRRAKPPRPLPSVPSTCSTRSPMRLLDAWARVLREAKGSRLLLKTRALAEESLSRALRSAFAARGIDAGRLELVGWARASASTWTCNKVSISRWILFPTTAHPTTCEAMWMGCAGGHPPRLSATPPESGRVSWARWDCRNSSPMACGPAMSRSRPSWRRTRIASHRSARGCGRAMEAFTAAR